MLYLVLSLYWIPNYSAVISPASVLDSLLQFCIQSRLLTRFLISVLLSVMSLYWIPYCSTVPIVLFVDWSSYCSAVPSPVSLLNSLFQSCTQSCIFTGFLIAVLYPVLSIDWIPYCSAVPSPVY